MAGLLFVAVHVTGRQVTGSMLPVMLLAAVPARAGCCACGCCTVRNIAHRTVQSCDAQKMRPCGVQASARTTSFRPSAPACRARVQNFSKSASHTASAAGCKRLGAMHVFLQAHAQQRHARFCKRTPSNDMTLSACLIHFTCNCMILVCALHLIQTPSCFS